MVRTLFLRLIARNIPAIISFFDAIEAHLDTLVKNANAELTVIDRQISSLYDKRSNKGHEIIIATSLKEKLPR
jgi:hypothetical protein